jgi:hypothetical protein
MTPFSWWRGGSLANKTLVLLPELGLGDQIHWVRYVPVISEKAHAQGGRVLFYCWSGLEGLFARSLEGCQGLLAILPVGEGISIASLFEWEGLAGHTVLKSDLFDVPVRLEKTVNSKYPYLSEKVPYLIPDPIKVEGWRARLAGESGLKVGLSWTGRGDHPRKELRDIPALDLLGAIAGIQGVSFYSLQKDRPVSGLVDFTPEFECFDDTAAFVCNLDLVITIDGVISHLAGALNVPLWVLVDASPHYTWEPGKRSPWYPSARIYGQEKLGDWANVLQEVRQDLLRLIVRRWIQSGRRTLRLFDRV